MVDCVAAIDPLTDSRWDTFVERHPFGWLCHTSGWKKVLETSFPHLRGYCLALIRNDEIVAGLPLFELKSWLAGHHLVSIPFATISDPLVSNDGEMGMLFNAALHLGNSLGARSVEIRTLKSAVHIRDKRLAVKSLFKHHYLLLDRTPEELMKSFHRTSVRHRISRALQSGIDVSEGGTESDLKEFFRLYLLSRKRIGLPPQPYRFIHALWEVFYPQSRITLLMARKGGESIAGLMLFKFQDRVSMDFAVHDDRFLNISPLHLLFWEAIQAAQREGFRIFDFGRTAPDHETLMVFKKRWGTTVVDLPHYRYPAEAFGGEAEQNGSFSRKAVSALCKVAPKPIFVGLGKILYQHKS